MKSFRILLLSYFFSIAAFAQTPQKMNFQAVIRNSANDLVSSQPVNIRISLLQGSVSGTPVYVENHAVSTNINGLATLEIGNGTVQSGDFATIDWSAGPYFLKTETDPNGGNNYSVTGVSQFLSVPYALFAERCNTPGPQGAPGNDGSSAYQVAVQNGFQGSETQWLASLQGTAGTNGTNGMDGSDGASAYQIAVQNGFQGSETQWLASLQGAAGTNGSNGMDGSDGASAYQIAVQNGFQGSETQWLASLQGVTGANGLNGNDGKNTLVNTTVEPAGSHCSTGGVKMEYGKDENSNGVLDALEIDNSLTRFVCNGATGSQGPQGPAGTYSAGNGISISNGTISSVPVEYAYLMIGNAVQTSAQILTPQWQVQTNGIYVTNGTTFTLNANKLYEITAVFQIYNVAPEQYTFMFYNVTSSQWMGSCAAYFGESGNDRSYRNETMKFMWKSSNPTDFELRKFSTNSVNGNLIGSIMIKEIR
ncbi:MAG: hypothetical protein RL213_1784 [Bacteroidota bacterium]